MRRDPNVAFSFITLTVVFVLISSVKCLPNGAPKEACATMTPDHYFPAQTDPCPFESVPQSVSIYSNSTLQLEIIGNSMAFRGFLLMAFDESGVIGGPLGTFSNPSSGKLLDCSPATPNAVTHSEAGEKSSVSVSWNPPIHFDGSVIFKTTFVQQFDIYWVAQESVAVQVRAVNDTDVTTTAIPTVTSSTPVSPVPSIYDGCGRDKGCFGTPDSCVNSGTCTMMVTYAFASDEQLQLELYGRVSANEYVAVGFSKDDRMGDDCVTECVLYGNQIDAYTSFNVRGANQRLSSEGLKLLEQSYQDGYLYCKVRRVANFTVNDLNFNLEEPHFLLLATGSASSGNIEYHSSRVASREAVALNEFDVPESSGQSLLKRLHGSLMTTAWLMTGSIATLLPRYMKKTWVGKQLMGKDLWFFLHRSMMIKVWVLTVAAFVLIFIDVGGWVAQPISQNAHPLIGCLATGLTFIQPFMAAFRPAPNAAKRFIFNWAHSIVGYSAHALAITCIYLAVEMEAANLPFCTYWVLAAHSAVYITSQIIFTLLSRRSRRLIKSGHSKAEGDEPGSGIRKTVLAVYSLIVVALTATVVVLLALGQDRVGC